MSQGGVKEVTTDGVRNGTYNNTSINNKNYKSIHLPSWWGKEIEEDPATDEEITFLEKLLNRKEEDNDKDY